MTIYQTFKQWASKPFDTEMDLTHWFLFLLLVLIAIGFWKMVLTHVEGSL